MTTDELSHLLERARQRAPEALAELCERFYPDVLKYTRYRVGAEGAEDLTEEVFLRVVRSIGTQSGSFHAWLYRVAANVVTDWYRRRKADERVRIDADAVERTAAADRPAERVEQRLDVAAAVARLTDDQRELVTLKFIQGLSNAEIGEITGRSPEAIRALQFRALASLRSILGEEEQ